MYRSSLCHRCKLQYMRERQAELRANRLAAGMDPTPIKVRCLRCRDKTRAEGYDWCAACLAAPRKRWAFEFEPEERRPGIAWLLKSR